MSGILFPLAQRTQFIPNLPQLLKRRGVFLQQVLGVSIAIEQVYMLRHAQQAEMLRLTMYVHQPLADLP